MEIKRALAIRDRAQAAIADVFSHAGHFGLTSKEMETRKHEALDRCGVRNAPHWVSSYLEGYWRCLIAGAYSRELVFGGKIDGQFYSTYSDRPDYYSKHGFSPLEYSDDGRVQDRGHYWRELLKPFYVHKEG